MDIAVYIQLLRKLDFQGNSLLQVSFIVVVDNILESMLSTKLFFLIISFKKHPLLKLLSDTIASDTLKGYIIFEYLVFLDLMQFQKDIKI